MSKQNNMFGNTTSAGDASMRFNKRPRFVGGVNSSGSTRHPHQGQASYQQQYTAIRNNMTETYQSSPKQYDSGSRLFYGQSLPNKPLPQHNHPMQISKPSPLTYSHNMESSSSSFLPTTPNTLKPPPQIRSTQASSTARIAQNNQQHQPQQPPQHGAQNFLDNSNYYTYGYNTFYPSYGTDMVPSARAPTYSIPDAMSTYMWQTITSTPPPKLPLQTQQQQLPPPPLPQQQPPVPPPLPRNDNTPGLQPSPPLQPISTNTSDTTNSFENPNKAYELNNASKTIIKMKLKRKAMPTRYKLSKCWSEVDAAMALKAEEGNARKLQKDVILILRFPDPEISREIVKCYSPDIESVHFQLNFAPRYCLVHLKPGVDVEKTMETLSKIPFGTGYLSVEIKQIPHKAHSTKLNEIDPYTLYVGNLPTTIASKTLKDHFPGAARIDIGFARMKYTRYAFIRYQTVQQAIEAYKRMLDAEIGGRSLTIRFRRLTSTSDGNKDGDAENIDDAQEDRLSQITVASDDNLTTLNPIKEPSETLEDEGSIQDLATNKKIYTNNLSNETCHGSVDLDNNNGNTNSERCTDEVSNSHVVVSESTTANNVNKAVFNIKTDPDVDPDDIVERNEEITTRFDTIEGNVKHEKELATDFEFFAPASNQSKANDSNTGQCMVRDTISISTTTDETDTMSTMSASSLGEFLQTCQRPRVASNDIDDIIGSPLKKKSRQNNRDSIKTEPSEQLATTVRDNSQVISNNTVKREVVGINLKASVTNTNNREIDERLQQSRNTTETIHKKSKSSRLQKTNASNARHQNPSNNSDNMDMVPANALFLRADKQNSLAMGYDRCDDDEFFETGTKTNAQTQSQVMENIKTEHNFIRTSTKQNKTTNSHRSESIGRNMVIDSITNRSQLPSTNTLTSIDSIILAAEDDDLVPEENILSSRLNTQQSLDIKQESENEEFFFTSSHTNLGHDTTNSINEDSDLSDMWSNNLLTQNISLDISNKIQKPSEVSRSCTPMATCSSEDNDIILVSENISQLPKNSSPKLTSLKSNNFSYSQTDLSIFNSKTTAAITTFESSKLLSHHHDNLDKLFAQLDSDTDSEL